jgi:cbb3-type cytochrome oxidase subunit 3
MKINSYFIIFLVCFTLFILAYIVSWIAYKKRDIKKKQEQKYGRLLNDFRKRHKK